MNLYPSTIDQEFLGIPTYDRAKSFVFEQSPIMTLGFIISKTNDEGSLIGKEVEDILVTR